MGKYLNVQEAAQVLNVSRTTMSQYLRQGRVTNARLVHEGDGDVRGNRWLIPNPPKLKEPKTLTVGEAAKRLGVTRAYVWLLVNEGVIKATRDEDGRWWRVSRRSLEAYASKREANARELDDQ